MGIATKQEQTIDIIQAIRDKNLFGSYFKDLKTWRSWLVFFKVLSGYKRLNDEEMALFRECTGLDALPSKPLREVFICAGRRSGKSTVVSLLSVFFAIWGGWEKYLSPGEEVHIFIISATKDQCNVIKDKISAILDLNQSLRRLVRKELAESIELVNNVTITIKPSSWRSTRGFTVGLLLMEELAYWRFELESANRDKEVFVAVKPAMMTIKNSLTLGISTPFARQGLLWEKFDKNFGKPGPVLVWRAPTWTMNLMTNREELEAENLETMGEAEFGAEFGAKFREDIESYLPMEIYERAVDAGITMRPEKEGVEYVAFCDPSEGLRKGGDPMTAAIAHAEEDEDGQSTGVLDVLLEFRPPFDPGQVIESIVQSCKSYNVTKIVQDRHAIAWIAKDFKEYNIEVEVSEYTKSQIYELFAVEMNKGLVELLDNERLKAQTLGLQRFLKGGGMVKIDHYRGGHDDCINSAAGAIVLLTGERKSYGAGVPAVGIREIWGEEGPSIGEAFQTFFDRGKK